MNIGNNLKKRKLLLDLKKEIISLENQIKNPKLIKFKKSSIKNLKISARFLQLIAPYALTTGIILTSSKFTMIGSPFSLDYNTKLYSYTMNEFDSLGNIRQEQQYNEFENDTNVINLYSKWNLGKDGFYSRTKTSYNIKNFSKEEILELIKNPKTIYSLEYLFGKPINEKKEYVNNMPILEKENTEMLQAIIYDKNKDNFIFIKETPLKNIGVLVLYIVMIIGGFCMTNMIRRVYSSFNFEYCIKDIKGKYNNDNININKLTKILEIKKENYNRLSN